MRSTVLRGRPEERFKFAIGMLAGVVVALPVNVLTVTNWRLSPVFGYVLVGIVVACVAFRNRSFVVGASSSILLVSLPQAAAALLPSPVTYWHVSAVVLWLVALAILGCLYLMREAETRTNADIDAGWLLRPQE